MAEAFEFTYKRVEKRREQKEVSGIQHNSPGGGMGGIVSNVNLFECFSRQVLVMRLGCNFY